MYGATLRRHRSAYLAQLNGFLFRDIELRVSMASIPGAGQSSAARRGRNQVGTGARVAFHFFVFFPLYLAFTRGGPPPSLSNAALAKNLLLSRACRKLECRGRGPNASCCAANQI